MGDTSDLFNAVEFEDNNLLEFPLVEWPSDDESATIYNDTISTANIEEDEINSSISLLHKRGRDDSHRGMVRSKRIEQNLSLLDRADNDYFDNSKVSNKRLKRTTLRNNFITKSFPTIRSESTDWKP